MGKKIIVAGGGHGGIPAAAQLAEAGFDVTVYEKGKKGQLGYDWTDIFAPQSISIAGMNMPPRDKYEFKTDMTFYSPGGKTSVRQNVPDDELEIKMERRDIYEMMVNHALSCGVKFEYEHTVLAPVMQGNRVIGIKTDKGDFYADLVIDACGCESPVRSNLPDGCLIEKHPAMFEKFYIYRGFYNKAEQCGDCDKYKVFLLPESKLGIGWVASEDEYTDLLIGRFEPFDIDEVNRTAEYFRQKNKSLGTQLVRGGQFVQIPVRQPLSVLVCDGYAAIGDSAFMTVPVIGSGIANSFRASKMLAETIINDKTETFSAETLWQYQKAYYKNLGNGLAPLACIKLLLTQISPEQLDFTFDNGILTSTELTITANSTSIFDFFRLTPDLGGRGLKLMKDPDLFKKVLKAVSKAAGVYAHCLLLPEEYSKPKVKKWSDKYCKYFK